MNILITGGAGFIGSTLAEKLLEKSDNKILIIDDLSTGSKQKLPSTKTGNFKFVKADANKYDQLASIMQAHSFDYVFHYAAVVGVKRTLENPINVLDDIEGIKHILELSRLTKVKRFFYASSSEVYGEPLRTPQSENSPLNTRLPYAAVKNIGECLCRAYNQEFGLNYTIFRIFNTYGPKQSEDFVLSRFVKKALNNEELIVYGDGSQTRTFCYVKDNVDAVTNALYQNKFINDVANIGNENEITIKKLAKKIIKITNSNSKILHKPARTLGDMKRRKPEISRMKKLLPRRQTSLNDGIQKTIDYLNDKNNYRQPVTVSASL